MYHFPFDFQRKAQEGLLLRHMIKLFMIDIRTSSLLPRHSLFVYEKPILGIFHRSLTFLNLMKNHMSYFKFRKTIFCIFLITLGITTFNIL